MYKKLLKKLALLLLLPFLFLSCENLINSSTNGRLTFGINEDIHRYISSELKESNSITGETELLISCSLIKEEKTVNVQEKKEKLDTLDKAKFIFNNLEFGIAYHLVISISYKDIIVFDGSSSIIILNNENADTVVDITIYPHYSSISYNLNKGAFNKDTNIPTKYSIGSNFTLPTPILSGYYFLGWETDDGTKVTHIGKNNFIGDVKLTAKWQLLVDAGSVMFSKTGDVEYQEKIELTTATEGAEIYYTTDGVTTPSKNSTLYTEPIVIENDVTIKAVAIKEGMYDSKISEAKYTVLTYNITFSNGGKGGSVYNPINNVTRGYTFNPEVLQPLSEVGYTFNGWKDSDGVTVDSSYTVTKSTTVTAQWSIENYSISYQTDDGTSITDSGSIRLAESGAATSYNIESSVIKLIPPAKDGYRGKWHKDTVDGAIVSEIPASSTGNIVLVAGTEWTPITYTVEYDSNGGKGTIAPLTVTYGTEKTLASNTFVKSGFKFVNWKTKVSGGDIKTVSSTDCVNQGDSITVYAIWEDIPPSPVTELKYAQSDKTVTLSWTLPTEEDLSHVKISYKETGSASEPTVLDNITGTSKKINNLNNNTKYTFTVIAVDNGANESTSESTSCFANPLQTFSTYTNYLSGYNGTAGSTGSYLTFGYWPQTVKASNVDIISTEPTTVSGGIQAYLGNDNYYYAKVTNPKVYNNDSTMKFSDGSGISSTEQYYFKIEPIKWRVLDNRYNYDDYMKLLVSEVALDCKQFDTNGSSTYKGSTIQTFLNDTFFEQAFPTEAKTSIVPQDYHSSVNKVFLLGQADVENKTYFDATDISSPNPKRERKATDYTKVLGINPSKEASYKDNALWWYRGDGNRNVTDTNGSCPPTKFVIPTDESTGVVPALVYGSRPSPTVNKFMIPKASTRKQGSVVPFTIYGENFVRSGESISITTDQPGVYNETIEMISDKKLVGTFTIPSNKGTCKVTVSCGSASQTTDLYVGASTTYTIGDVIGKDRVVKSQSALEAMTDDDRIAFDPFGVFLGTYTIYGAPIFVSLVQTHTNYRANNSGRLPIELSCKLEGSPTLPASIDTVHFTTDSNSNLYGGDDWVELYNFDKEAYLNSGNWDALHYAVDYNAGGVTWYIPTAPELVDVCKNYINNKATIETVLTLCLNNTGSSGNSNTQIESKNYLFAPPTKGEEYESYHHTYFTYTAAGSTESAYFVNLYNGQNILGSGGVGSYNAKVILLYEHY